MSVPLVDMLVRLYDLPPLDGVLGEVKSRGVCVRRAFPFSDRTVLGDWVLRQFSRGWADECEAAFSHQPVGCFLAVRGGRPIGFCCYNTMRKGVFGPIGVDPSEHGMGLGKALLLTGLHAMAWEGYAYAVIGGVGPREFYSKVVGATVIADSSPGMYRDMLRSQDPPL